MKTFQIIFTLIIMCTINGCAPPRDLVVSCVDIVTNRNVYARVIPNGVVWKREGDTLTLTTNDSPLYYFYHIPAGVECTTNFISAKAP